MSTELVKSTEHWNPRLDNSLFSKELAPHYMQLATKLSSSALVPKSYQNKPQDLFLCWAMGYQMGISPEQAMQCIAIINGRPTMWGDEMLALCMSHPDFEDITEVPIDREGSVIGYTCTIKRRGMTPTVNIFTLDMAKKAGLLGKAGPWTQYPERMLKLRARGFALRDTFPDALKGIKSREEVEDYIEGEYRVIDEGLSRTEQLKKDYLTKTGKADESTNSVSQGSDVTPSGNDLCNENNVAREETKADKISNSTDEVTFQATDLHDQIKKLILAKEFDEERLSKALKYYDVKSIDELPQDLAEHFINKLNKL